MNQINSKIKIKESCIKQDFQEWVRMSKEQSLQIARIKECIKQIANLGEKLGTNVSDSDRKLSDEIVDLSITMFGKKKILKSFTVLKDKDLAKIQIDEETGSFNEEDIIFLDGFFKNPLHNLDAFSQLVVYSYSHLKKKAVTKHSNNDLIFYANIYSRYSGEMHDVFFINDSNEYYIFDDEVVNSKFKFIDYINDHFGDDETTIKALVDLSKSDGVTFINAQSKITKIFNDFSEKTKENYDFINGTITFLDFLGMS